MIGHRDEIFVTFVIPSDNRSGGVRVTVTMANLLIKMGYQVRIVHPIQLRFSHAIRNYASIIRTRQRNSIGWLHLFFGKIERYRKLDDLKFCHNEIVIAVGSLMVDDLRVLNGNVIKVRYNHGFPYKPTEKQQRAWKGSMTTITVSNTLVPQIEKLSGEKVAAVIPNGIDTTEYYFDNNIDHIGIGAIYNSHPNKGSTDMIKVLRAARIIWPNVPQFVFGAERRPKQLRHTRYKRYPSIENARRIYNRCKIWLLTSYTEGFGLPVLEAMACGCIVISSDNDGSSEIIKHHENGILVPKGHLTTYLSQIDSILTDDLLAHEITQKSKNTIDLFTWDKALAKMDEFLLTIFSSNS